MVTKDFENYIKELFDQINIETTNKRMFGGVCIFFNKKAFALISDNVLYLKIDENSIKKYFEYEDTKSFSPFKTYSMKYQSVPTDVLESRELFFDFVMDSLNLL